MTTFTLDLSPVVEAKLDRIIELLSKLDAAPAAAPVKAETPSPAPAAPASAPASAPAPEVPAAKPCTKADLSQLVVRLSAAGLKAQVREIITAYADRVSNIPEDKYAEVMAKLTALEGSGQV